MPDFGDCAFIEHHNIVRAADRGKAMGDHENGAPYHQVRERLLHEFFGFGVEFRGGLIENQDWRILQQGAGDGDALPLAAAQPLAAIADHVSDSPAAFAR